MALFVGGTSPCWWNEFFRRDSQPTSPSPVPTSSVIPTDLPSSSAPIQRTSVSVAYRGDAYGCSLPLSIQIGDQEFYPQGYFFEVNGIMTGQQEYQIDRQIQCPIIGTCHAHRRLSQLTNWRTRSTFTVIEQAPEPEKAARRKPTPVELLRQQCQKAGIK